MFTFPYDFSRKAELRLFGYASVLLAVDTGNHPCHCTATAADACLRRGQGSFFFFRKTEIPNCLTQLRCVALPRQRLRTCGWRREESERTLAPQGSKQKQQRFNKLDLTALIISQGLTTQAAPPTLSKPVVDAQPVSWSVHGGWQTLDLFAESQRPWNAAIWKRECRESSVGNL